MKIVGLQEFLDMPEGTIFQKYQPCVFDCMMVKCKSIEESNDFDYIDLGSAVDCPSSSDFHKILDRAQETGCSFRLDFEIQGRDGCYEPKQLFAIWEKADVDGLVGELRKAAFV